MKQLIKTTILLLSAFMLTHVCAYAQDIKAGEAAVDLGSTTSISLAATYERTLRNATGVSARWSSSNSNITITSQTKYDCIIKGVTPGTARVNFNCSYTLNGYYRTMAFYWDVTINGILTISPTSITLEEGETYSVTAYQPGYIGGVYFTSSNSNIASVSTGDYSGNYTYGTVTAKSKGTAYIYAHSMNGATSSACTVKVNAKVINPTGITVQPNSINIVEGDYANLSATLSPSNATCSLIWSSSDTDVATVTSSGRIYGKAPGIARITAKTNGYSFSDYCDVTVNARQVLATSISADVPTGMQVGDTFQLSPSYEPGNADVSFLYESDNAEIVSVSATGLLTASETGTATITLTESISQLKETFTIVVSDPNIPDTEVSNLDNIIYINNFDAYIGQELNLSFQMKNTASIRGFQFDLYLPEGVSVVKSAMGKIQGSLCSDRLPDEDEHQLTFSEQADGAIRFLCGSQYDENFIGSDGEIATLRISISKDIEAGDYPIILKNMVLNETDITTHYDTALLKSTLSISYKLGDINGDGIVNVLDYTGVANYIHGNIPEGFNPETADVNGDNVINVLDYTGVANIIHTGYASGRSNARMLIDDKKDLDAKEPQ